MLRPSAERVQRLLEERGHPGKVREFADTTKSSAEAAQQIGCSIGQIAKSLVFRARTSGRPVLVIASGANRVDEKKVAAVLGEKLGRADPDYVRERTGFAIGGVPPIGHAEPPIAFIDRDLLQYAEIWAAAGTPFAVFLLTPADLERLTGGRVIDVKIDVK
jgi:prolyl-tRNA editing enzyme YbaK/EbsC (Cys-tRNA(Pro) deacylase)